MITLSTGFTVDSSNQINSITSKNIKQKELIQQAIIQIANTGKMALHTKQQKKFILSNVTKFVIGIFIVGAIALFAITETGMFSKSFDSQLKSGYQIYNLRGDIIDTWMTWRIVEGDIFHVHVRDSKYLTDERKDAIIDIILSQEAILIDDTKLHKGTGQSQMFIGWTGALNSIEEKTQFFIPKNLHFNITDKEEGDIIINLVSESHPDGYAGFTKLVSDETHNQILKAEITIFNVEKMSLSEFRTIIRHELGHAFGLAHSTAPEDLMHPVILTEYPFISECNIQALTELYDGSQKSQIICEK